jgi:hypothetical protein
VGAWRSVADLFHSLAACVTKVSPPLRGTVIWSVLADRVVFALAVSLSLNKMEPTWFLAPLCPSSLW